MISIRQMCAVIEKDAFSALKSKVFETFLGDCLFENVTRFLFKKDGSVKAIDFYKTNYYM